MKPIRWENILSIRFNENDAKLFKVDSPLILRNGAPFWKRKIETGNSNERLITQK